MSNAPINTAPIQQLIQQIKVADLSNQKEVKIDIATAKNVAYTPVSYTHLTLPTNREV